jgi:hypothetical protein
VAVGNGEPLRFVCPFSPEPQRIVPFHQSLAGTTLVPVTFPANARFVEITAVAQIVAHVVRDAFARIQQVRRRHVERGLVDSYMLP